MAKKAIIVDDETAIPKLLAILLRQTKGYEVETFAKGDDALARIRELYNNNTPPDLLFTDNDMECRGRGVQLLQEVRDIERNWQTQSAQPIQPTLAIVIAYGAMISPMMQHNMAQLLLLNRQRKIKIIWTQ